MDNVAFKTVMKKVTRFGLQCTKPEIRYLYGFVKEYAAYFLSYSCVSVC